jgi:hypothetical protein
MATTYKITKYYFLIFFIVFATTVYAKKVMPFEIEKTSIKGQLRIRIFAYNFIAHLKRKYSAS